MTTQPEALRLAALLDINHHEPHVEQAAAAELRRLYAEVEALRAAQGEQKPAAWLHKNRLGGVQAFTTEPPPGLKAQCQPLYASPVAPTAQEPVGARYRRIGRHVAEIAKRLGRPDDSAEGELEYIQRLSYSQGLEDASPVATHGEQLANPAEMATWLMARRSHLGSSRGSSIAWGGEWGAINWDNYTKLAQHFAALSATPVATTKDDEA